ncbi:UPF0104 family protein [Brevibacillus fluminis]|uniref:Phosphatidylglycerol lysyltransferase n=1 Tax=Brevibacillus fluminis TaxID=511487 RepID=A0A3M8D4C7_9BACL|nr:lysylphosphatidylglycerol synthase transmembrane domain-containing protein [Brevibacillus fluminis]RNB82728.1 UPF0104 family protein [Brevibacillus fluminis]
MKRKILFWAAWCLILVSAYLAVTQLNGAELWEGAKRLAEHWWLLVLMAVCYAAAFWLRSVGWQIQMGKTEGKRATVEQLWLYHHIGLFLNHILPIKGGELARAGLLKAKHHLDWGQSLYSVGVNRLLDMSALFVIACLTMFVIAPEMLATWFGMKNSFTQFAPLVALSVVYAVTRMARRYQDKLPPLVGKLLAQRANGKEWWLAFAFTALGWMLEAAVIGSVVVGLGGSLSAVQAMLVHVLTIMGQTLHVTPGGIGTYEAVMSTLLVQVAGKTLVFALQAAILSHGFKFLYSFLMGGYAAWRLSLSPLQLYRQAKEERGGA